MVTLLILALAIIAVIGIALYFWQKPRLDSREYALPPPPDARSLFGDTASNSDSLRQSTLDDRQTELLISRAQKGERSALAEAHQMLDSALYNRVQAELVLGADSNAKRLALLSYISQNDLPVTDKLAQAVITSWEQSPNRNTTSQALHFAALSDDPDLYRETVEQALQFWRAGKLAEISAVELAALFDSEFWILSSRSRSSGAGFILKQTLADARRELEATMRANQ